MMNQSGKKGGGRKLTLIHGNDKRTTTNAKTSHPSTNDHLVPLASRRTDLNDQTDVEDETPDSNGPFATQPVGQGGTAESTDQGTDGQQTDNQTGADGAEGIGAIGLDFTITLEIVAHLLETGDLTGIITEEQTTDGDESTHDKGAQGQKWNRGVNADIHGLLRRGLGLRSRRDFLAMVGGGFYAHDDNQQVNNR